MPPEDSLGDSSDGSILAPQVSLEAEPEPVPATDRPDLRRTAEALDRAPVRSLGVTLLVVLACLYTLYFARAFLLPLVVAVLLNFLFSPLIRALQRLRIPAPAGAALVVLGSLGVLSFGVYRMAAPAQEWIARAPETLEGATEKLRRIRQPVEAVSETAEQVEDAADMDGQDAPEVVVRGPSLIARLFGTTQTVVAGAIEVVIVLFFLLAAGDLFLQKLIKVLPQLSDKKKAVRIARETEESISKYLITVAVVNAAEGTVLALVLWAIGMPSPVLWGVLAFFLEFIPYIGATILVAFLTLAGVATFDSLGHALVAPAAFLGINLVQGNIVSPLVLGRRLTLNPVAIVVGLAFWWWIWGFPGAFVAVPLLATFKIICDHVEALAPVGEFLGK